MSDVMVSVCVLSYNHEKYLRQCLDGIFMQKVSFPFEVRVHDDASTDRSQEIIKEYQQRYPDILKPVLQSENQYSKGGGILNKFLLPLCEGKYIALCEGDDYWTDSLKLQKQVDFLEGHEEYSMCFHKVYVVYEGEIKQERIFDRLEEGDCSAYDIYADWLVPTCSVVYRNYSSPFESNSIIVFGDIFLWLQLAERGKLYCMGFYGGVYRRHEKGVSFSYSGSISAGLFRQYEFMEDRFPELRGISRMKKDQSLESAVFSPYFSGIWKYRFLYLFRHPKRFFTRLLPFLFDL